MAPIAPFFKNLIQFLRLFGLRILRTASVIKHPLVLSDVNMTRAVRLGQVCNNVRNDFWHVFLVERDGFTRELV